MLKRQYLRMIETLKIDPEISRGTRSSFSPRLPVLRNHLRSSRKQECPARNLQALPEGEGPAGYPSFALRTGNGSCDVRETAQITRRVRNNQYRVGSRVLVWWRVRGNTLQAYRGQWADGPRTLFPIVLVRTAASRRKQR